MELSPSARTSVVQAPPTALGLVVVANALRLLAYRDRRGGLEPEHISHHPAESRIVAGTRNTTISRLTIEWQMLEIVGHQGHVSGLKHDV
jgi:hypothetical protein